MRLGIRGAADSSLAIPLAWLTALRLGVLTIFLVVTTAVYLRGLTPGGFSSQVIFATLAAAYGLAGMYAAVLRVGRGLETLALVQLVTDQITWTVIAYVSGGATSGATSLYGLTCISGAILLGLRGALVAALWGVCTYALLCAGFVVHYLEPPHDQPADAYATQWPDIAYPMFVNLFAMAVVTILAGYLAERLRATGGRLVAATERAEQETARAELATARAEKAERLAALGRLAAGLAHEIRNPLGAIAGSIELLETGGKLSAEDRKLCELIQRETARLNDLVTDMLELSRPRAPVKAHVDLVRTAEDVVVLASQSGRGSDVRVRYEGPARAVVLADGAQMRQVIWNLVRNAILASSPGEEVVVRVASDPDGGWVLEIVDDGAGIPAEARDRLFDAFFTTRSHGVGIGLAVVKRIADDHGYAIEVDSEEGRGTTFRVRIPRVTSAELAEAEAALANIEATPIGRIPSIRPAPPDPSRE